MDSIKSKQLLMVCAPMSNSGKTLFSLWLLAQARLKGLRTQAIKLGPDYLDAKILSSASSNPVINIDPWAMSLKTQALLLKNTYLNSDFIIIEAMMGLFDGTFDGESSPDTFAKHWGIPWILVCSAKGQGASLAPMIKGLLDSASTKCCGLIINNLGTENHKALILNAINSFTPDQDVLAAFFKNDNWVWPSKYLGLRQGKDIDRKHLLNRVSSVPPIHGKIENLFSNKFKTSKPKFLTNLDDNNSYLLPPIGNTIAIAKDDAFSFIYNAQLSVWKNLGSKIVTFSPLKNQPCPPCDAVYLPGGYPERYLNRICNAYITKKSLRYLARNNILIFGECGGATILGNEIIDKNAKKHIGWGLLDYVVNYNSPKRVLGYRTIELINPSWLGEKGDKYRGHEFHYGVVSSSKNNDCEPLWKYYSKADNLYTYEGKRKGSVMGTFIHLIDKC